MVASAAFKYLPVAAENHPTSSLMEPYQSDTANKSAWQTLRYRVSPQATDVFEKS